jgi:hypothetical protein
MDNATADKILSAARDAHPEVDANVISKIQGYLIDKLSEKELTTMELKKIAKDLLRKNEN